MFTVHRSTARAPKLFFLASLLAVVPSSLQSLAFAQPPPTIILPAECGSQDEVARALQGADPRSWRSIEVRREAALYRLRVILSDGERTLEDPDCRGLLDAAIVIVGAAGFPATEPGQSAVRVDPPGPSFQQRTESVGGDRATALWPRAALGGLAGVTYGVVPGTTAHVGIVLALEYPRFVLRARGLYMLPRAETDSSGTGVRVQAVGGGIEMGVSIVSRLTFLFGADLYGLVGRGVRPGQNHVPVADAAFTCISHVGASWGLWRRGPWRVEVEGAALIAIARSQFVLADDSLVFSQPRWGARGSLAAFWNFL